MGFLFRCMLMSFENNLAAMILSCFVFTLQLLLAKLLLRDLLLALAVVAAAVDGNMHPPAAVTMIRAPRNENLSEYLYSSLYYISLFSPLRNVMFRSVLSNFENICKSQ